MSGVKWIGGTPLKDEGTIREFEQLAGIEFPEEFKETVKKHNGAAPVPSYVHVDGSIEGDFKVVTLLSFNKGDKLNIFQVFEETHREISGVAFAISDYSDDGDYNEEVESIGKAYFCFDNYDDYGGILFASCFDSGYCISVADSFNEFLGILKEKQSESDDDAFYRAPETLVTYGLILWEKGERAAAAKEFLNAAVANEKKCICEKSYFPALYLLGVCYEKGLISDDSIGALSSEEKAAYNIQIASNCYYYAIFNAAGYNDAGNADGWGAGFEKGWSCAFKGDIEGKLKAFRETIETMMDKLGREIKLLYE